jgi:hypothetical protein
MARIRSPDLPLRLYRYCRLDRPHDVEHEIDAIVRRYIHCSSYKQMYDPMEGFYEPSVRLKREPEWRKTFRSILEAKQTVGIACFTETHDNEIMWAHYAGNYQGACIAYSATKLRDNLPKPAELARMAYADVPVRLSKHDKTDIYAAAHKILSHKKYNWAYEREWRVMGEHPGELLYEGDVVTDIYFGSRAEAHPINRMAVTLGGRSIRFHQMKVTGYRHKWTRI